MRFVFNVNRYNNSK